MRLSLLFGLPILLLLILIMSTPPPTPSSSLAHRHVTSVRSARRGAMAPIYCGPRSPRASSGRRPLQDVGNMGPARDAHLADVDRDLADVDREHRVLRDADRERQQALQETPSRRRRRIPNENRQSSPTPGPSRPRVQAAPQGLLTPAATNADAARRDEPNARSLAQQRRRQREAEARERPLPQENPRATAQRERRQREADARLANTGPVAPPNPPNARAAAQIARRERERQQRENGQLLTPPATRDRAPAPRMSF
ncbi:hypothetical protein B0H10DRAFT_1947207 [Mycena sp. CBHHK59/15]|nr:hypothetical protein B0H10DRAFT_1947207 [Mycena sp. CBHHK59/15]